MAQDVLAGRHALVTGGARGLGAGMAQALAAAGAAVMIGDVLDDLAGETARARRPGHTPRRHRRGAWEAAVAATVEQLGGLDILVNNAGIEISGLIVDAEAADLRRMLEVNVLGTALGIKHGLRAMRLRRPATAAPSSTSHRSRRRSRSPGSRATPPPSRRSTGSPASPRSRPASSASACA